MNPMTTLALHNLQDLASLFAVRQQQQRKLVGWTVRWQNGGPDGGQSEPLLYSFEFARSKDDKGVLLIGCRGTVFPTYMDAVLAVITTVQYMTEQKLSWTKMYGPLLILPVYS